MQSTIAKNVQKMIRQKGVKQYVVAKMAGYSEKSFSNMLNGRKLITDNDIGAEETRRRSCRLF